MRTNVLARILLLVALLCAAACASATTGGGNGNDSGVPSPGDDGGGDDPHGDGGPNGGGPDAASGSPDGGGGSCPTQPCDLIDQCGCAGGQACDLDYTDLANGTTACRSAFAQGDETSTCINSTDCGAGYVCVSGRCRAFCETDTDCNGGSCVIHLTYQNQDIPGAITCATGCNPVAATNNGCPAGWGCHVYLYDPPPAGGTDTIPITDCDLGPTSGGAAGAACTSSATCQPTLDCINTGGGSQCRPNCVCPGGNCTAGTCPSGTGACLSFTPPNVVNGVTYGTCL